MTSFDIIIIGAGPGGYEMAALAAKRGLNVAIVERDHLGGTCLNRGCIPTKTLCHNADVLRLLGSANNLGIHVESSKIDFAAMINRKNTVVEQLRQGVETLLSIPQITLIRGNAKFVSSKTIDVDGEQYTSSNIVIATGSVPRNLPIPGSDLDGIMSSDDILELTELPQSLCIVGGGVIGMEFAGIFSTLGTQVTVVEYCKEILPPFDRDVAKRLRTTMAKAGTSFATNAAVKSISGTPGNFVVTYESKGKEQQIECTHVLMAVGRKSCVPEGIENTSIELNPNGSIKVDDNMLTSVDGVYAIGDVNGRIMLAHAATAQGVIALDHITSQAANINLNVVPSAVFTSPELAMVGLTEDACNAQGLNVTVKKALFRANGKALAIDEPDGIVKMIVDNESHKVLGCQILGAHAADLIQEVALAMSSGLSVEAIASTIHAHPTLGEVVHAAATQF